ncbi:hypothetical protein [Phaeodactylibacter xiamenensis]|uniref:hypothetical protein n=1 Tax=Phaeodactylibacter xiamenensis TaxID=1524460 RepID=UPI003CCC130D
MQVVIPKLKKILLYFWLLPIGLCAQNDEAASISPQPLVFTGTHGTVFCQDSWQVPPPVLSYSSSETIFYTFEDQYFNLSCQSQGWQGYFAWSNWRHATKDGDGGVDVTGAPNSVLVEGANSASILLTPGSQAAYELAIPADGFVRFDWSYVGGSSFSDHTFNVFINSEAVPALCPEQPFNTFYSSFLNTGDTLRLVAEAQEKGLKIRLSNFEFLSNALGVVERLWVATDKEETVCTFRQLISVEKPGINNIIFPESFDGSEAPILEDPATSGPAHTGFPVVDTDGDRSTTHDQISLDEESYSFIATWEDETLYENGFCIIYRKWSVRDLCGQNIYHSTQTLKVAGGCPNWGVPIPHLHQAEGVPQPNFEDIAPDSHTLTKIMHPATDWLRDPLNALYP